MKIVDREPNLTLEVIRTNRLVLRPPQAVDAEAMYERWGKFPEVVRYLTWGPNKSIDEVVGLIQSSQEAWERGVKYSRLVTLEDEVIGMVDLRDHGFKADIGFILAPDFQGSGFMTEAVRAVVNGALSEPRIYRVWGEADAENLKSANVMLRAGMKREGLVRRAILVNENNKSEPRDALIFAKAR
jgi:[ribosomal protein S5]-alanine N-acetyltransferase